jgi:hypothetical protein
MDRIMTEKMFWQKYSLLIGYKTMIIRLKNKTGMLATKQKTYRIVFYSKPGGKLMTYKLILYL